jgi:hypothetical protein
MDKLYKLNLNSGEEEKEREREVANILLDQ